jgi:hypothetical protein
MERAMGIETTSEAWEANSKARKRISWCRIYAFFEFPQTDSNWTADTLQAQATRVIFVRLLAIELP